MQIPYEIISTGSQGNAVVINERILIDCGVPYKDLVRYARSFSLVLLTHIHSDHFNPATIRKLAAERPLLRWGCCRWLVKPLVDAGVNPSNIDILSDTAIYNYGFVKIRPVILVHNVPNCGYKLQFACPEAKVFYATDTNNLNGIEAKNYDLYLIEANYEDADIQARIAAKKETGEYAYEQQVLNNHLSKAKCDDFIYKNIGPRGEYVYLHTHKDRAGKEPADGHN